MKFIWLVALLALSGGGEDGAFGAGLLVGWTARGDRPEFELVTGVVYSACLMGAAYIVLTVIAAM